MIKLSSLLPKQILNEIYVWKVNFNNGKSILVSNSNVGDENGIKRYIRNVGAGTERAFGDRQDRVMYSYVTNNPDAFDVELVGNFETPEEAINAANPVIAQIGDDYWGNPNTFRGRVGINRQGGPNVNYVINLRNMVGNNQSFRVKEDGIYVADSDLKNMISKVHNDKRISRGKNKEFSLNIKDYIDSSTKPFLAGGKMFYKINRPELVIDILNRLKDVKE